MAEPIVLSNITFQAINKWTYTTRQHLTFLSTKDGSTITLSAYKSMSELGYWRLFVRDIGGVMYYKGKDIIGVDYVQQTFIDIQLQKYFNRVFDSLPNVDGDIEASKYLLGDHAQSIRNHIDDETRIEHIEPFYSYYQDKENRCGVRLEKSTRNEDLLNLSSKVQAAFPTPGVPELVYENYNFLNTYIKEEGPGLRELGIDEKISVTGDIYKIKLGTIEDKEIIFYFLLYSLQTSYQSTHVVVIDPAKVLPPSAPESRLPIIRKEYKNNIHSPLNIQYKFAPVFLTTSNDITSYGIYAKYILAGKYICKVLEYHNYCLPRNKKCTELYTYVGHMYENIYPYTLPIIQELAQKKKIQENTAAKGSGGAYTARLSKEKFTRVRKGGRKNLKRSKRKTRKTSKARV